MFNTYIFNFIGEIYNILNNDLKGELLFDKINYPNIILLNDENEIKHKINAIFEEIEKYAYENKNLNSYQSLHNVLTEIFDNTDNIQKTYLDKIVRFYKNGIQERQKDDDFDII